MSRITVVCMVLITMLFTLGVACADEWYDRVSVSGYAQARYQMSDMGWSQFDLTRLFLTVRAKPTDNATVIFTLFSKASSVNVELYNAFVDWKINDQYAVQVGQVPTWFGYNGWRGSSVRTAWERPRIIQGTPPGQYTATPSPDGRVGFYVLGAPDRGIWLRRNPSGSEPLVIVGVCNGQFRAGDANSTKNIEAHVKFTRDWGAFGASWMDGTFTAGAGQPWWPAGTTPRDAFGLYCVVNPAPWGFEGEWATGKMLGRDRDGYRVQGMYATGSGTAYVSYEDFTVDPSIAFPITDTYDALTLGYAWDLDAANTVTVQYTKADWTSGPIPTVGEDYGGIQWQYSYK